MDLEIGDVVLCTVDRIEGTTVFVNIEENGQGTIVLSEIAPGRIRNLRDYVLPKKVIVCKVLKISQDRIELSLRRVSQKEQKEVKDQYNKERSSRNILKAVLGEKADKIIEKIEENEKTFSFLEKSKEDSKELEKLVGKEDSEKIIKILNSQKQKKEVIKKEIFLNTTKSNGLELIKQILEKINAEVKYISAGKYSIKVESNDIKKSNTKMKEILDNLEKESKKIGLNFSVK